MKAISNNSLSAAPDREVDFLNILIEVADIVTPEGIDALIEVISASSKTASVVSNDEVFKKTLRATILDFKSRTGARVPTRLDAYEDYSFLGMLALIMALAKWPDLSTGTGFTIRVLEYSDTFKSLNEFGLPTSAVSFINNRMQSDAKAFMNSTSVWLDMKDAERFCTSTFPNVLRSKKSVTTRALEHTPLAREGKVSAVSRILLLPVSLAMALTSILVLLSFVAPFKSLAMQTYLRNTHAAVVEAENTEDKIMASGMVYGSYLTTLKMYASDMVLVYGHIIKLYLFLARAYAAMIFAIPSVLSESLALIMDVTKTLDAITELVENMFATRSKPSVLKEWVAAVSPAIETFIVSYIAGKAVAADGTLFSIKKAASIKAALMKDFYNVLAILFANTSYEEFIKSIFDEEAFTEAKNLLEFYNAFAKLSPSQITFLNASELLDARNNPGFAPNLKSNSVDLKNISTAPDGSENEEL